MDRKQRYIEHNDKVKKYENMKITTMQQSDVNKSLRKLQLLTEVIPNWETYLTDKQLEAVRLFLANKDLSLCDVKLDLAESGTYKRIFGSQQHNRVQANGGALGKLEKVYIMLREKQA